MTPTLINNSRLRLEDIDRAKGLAILLVVFGHIVARQPPLGNEWYLTWKHAIYSFHMAFFMFLSGFVFLLTTKPVRSMTEYLAFARKRFIRLMPAYFLFALVVFAGKWFAQGFLHVDNPVSGLGDLIKVALFPMESVSAFLWYVYVLCTISIFSIAVISIIKHGLHALLIIGVGLQLLAPSDFLGADQFSKYFLFFALGGYASKYWEAYASMVDRYKAVAWGLFGAALFVGLFDGATWIVVALLAIPALHGLCRWPRLPKCIGDSLKWLGKMTFPIYLMNTICIGAAKAMMLKVVPWDGAYFMLYVPLLALAGLLLPILIKLFFIRRVAWLDRITS